MENSSERRANYLGELRKALITSKATFLTPSDSSRFYGGSAALDATAAKTLRAITDHFNQVSHDFAQPIREAPRCLLDLGDGRIDCTLADGSRGTAAVRKIGISAAIETRLPVDAGSTVVLLLPIGLIGGSLDKSPSTQNFFPSSETFEQVFTVTPTPSADSLVERTKKTIEDTLFVFSLELIRHAVAKAVLLER